MIKLLDLSKLDSIQTDYRRMLYVRFNNRYITLNDFKKISKDKNIAESSEMVASVKTFCGREIFLPSELSPELLYFLGVIAGDGTLPIKFNDRGKRMYVVVVEKANKDFILKVLRPLAESLFKIKWSCSNRKRSNRERVWCLYLYSKPLYLYITRLFDFPEGKKSHKIRLPEIVRKLEPEARLPFVVGLMDTDWGVIGHGNFGTHCASKVLLEDTRDVIKHLSDIKLKIRKVIQGKYTSYQMIVLKSEITKLSDLLNTKFPLKNWKRIKTFKTQLN